MKTKIINHFLVTILIVTAPIAYCDDWLSKGSIKYQLDQSFFRSDDLAVNKGGRLQTFHSGTFRYNIENNFNHWAYEANYALRYEYSMDANYDDGINSGVDYPPDFDRTKLLSLSRWLFTDTSQRARHALDRLFIGYTADQWSLKFGRQAISWGNGFNFNPMDLFNPFSPNVIDKEYKNGDDLVYGQWLLSSGSDLQLIIVPRREYRSENLSSSRSSVAIKYHGQMTLGEVDFLVSRHFDENLVGIGWVRSIGSAVARADATLSRSASGDYAAAGIVNADYSWTLFDFNMYGYSEYYYQSVGVKSVSDPWSSRLLDRITRSEIFVVGEHYLVGGVMVELSALVHFSPSIIINLADRSFIAPIRVTYDWKQNWTINAGVNAAYGKRNSEFGGIAQPGTTYFQAAGQSVFILVANYF